MSKKMFVDFRAVKAAITMERVLTHYGLMDQFKRGTDSLNGPCPIHKGTNPTQFRVTALRDCPVPEDMLVCETPEQAAAYWRLHIETHPHFNPECECFVILFLNVRKRVKGHQLLTIGTMDTVLVHPREVFRAAVISSAAGIVMMHNHPSGESTPSDADIKITRDLIRAGQLLKIEVIDHVVMGRPNFQSLRALGYFYS